MRIFHKDIPYYDSDKDEWSTMSFPNQDYFGKFLTDNCFKEPGEYNFDSSVHKIASLGKYWEKNKFYTLLPENTKDWYKFWDTEQKKCRLGVLLKSGNNTWYFTRDYYFFLNFCPIINKERGQEESMASFRDVQYHMMLYEKLAEIYHNHGVVLKRRQMLYSFCHVAKSLNFLWFENKKTIKWMAYNEAFIDDINGSWKFFNAYVNHLKKYTAWDKNLLPESFPEVQQKEKIRVQGRWLTDGNESTLVAKTLNKDPKKGVGGPAYWIWYEEGGIAPTANITLQYLSSNLESGIEMVGSFCIGGSVGDLKECKPLENFLKKPDIYRMYGVPTKWYDETGVKKICGLFIPAQYGMPQATDENGNSLVEEALRLLDIEEENWKKLPEPEYILKKSQNPRNIKEAFAYREVSKFPIRRIEKRQDFLKNSADAKRGKSVELFEDKDTGDIKYKLSNREEISYPVDSKAVDKEGVCIIYEDPVKGAKYYGGADTVEAGITKTSDSLYSIYIVKGRIEKTTIDENNTISKSIEHIKIVAHWTGRFDSADETNDYAIMLIKLYGAKTLVERNKRGMINRCLQKGIAALYLIKEKELPFNKELDFTKDYISDEYGIHMDSTGKKQEMCDDYVVDYLNEELDCKYKKDTNGNYTSEKLQIYYGIENINDYWLLEEFKYVGKDNTDRENAFRLAIVSARTFEIQGFITRVIENKNKTEKTVFKKSVSFLGSVPKNNKNKKYNKGISFLG